MAPGAVLEVVYPTAAPTARAVHEGEPTWPRPPRLLDRVRSALRARHGSRRTEKAYVGQAPSSRDGRRRGHAVPQLAGRREKRRRVYPEPGFERPGGAPSGVRLQHEADLRQGAGWVELPWALARKYPNAGREWAWQWVFPARPVVRRRLTGLLVVLLLSATPLAGEAQVAK